MRFDRVLSIDDITKTAADLPAHFKQLLNGPAARKSAREKARHEMVAAKKQDKQTTRQVTAWINAVVAKVEAQAKREAKKQRNAEKQARLQAQRAARREAKEQRDAKKQAHLQAQQAARREAKKQRDAEKQAHLQAQQAARREAKKHFPSRYNLDCGHCGRAIHVPTRARGTRCPECKQVTMAADHFAQSDQLASSKMAGGRKQQRGLSQDEFSRRKKRVAVLH